MTKNQRLTARSTFSSVLALRATRDPGAPFLLAHDSTLSFADVDDRSEALAASLANLGIESGDRIALVLPPWPEFAVSVFAAAKLGATIVPLNPRLTAPELRYMLRHSGAVCAITAEDAYGIDYLQLFEDLLVELPELNYLVTVGEEELWYDDRVFQWEDLISAGLGRDFRTHPADPGDPFAIVYTSGTTGKPKGVELSHGGLVHAARETNEAVQLGEGDVVVGVSSLFHAFGLGPGLRGPPWAGPASCCTTDWTTPKHWSWPGGTGRPSTTGFRPCSRRNSAGSRSRATSRRP